MREIILFILYICLFLIAMSILRHGLFQLAGNRLKKQLQAFTSSPIKGFFFGIFTTAILQSSSAVMVMTVGFVSVGAITFQQSLGIILGSNIGTTVTAEFMTFSIERWIGPGMILGFLLMLFKRHSIRYTGFSLFGICMIFFSIKGFTSLAEPLSQYSLFFDVLELVEKNTLFAIIVGAIITGIIHSSTGMIAIAMGFISGGQLSILAGIALMLGSNIGTCVTGYMASIGAGKEAKLTAYAHIWINILGVLLFYPFIKELQLAAAFFSKEAHVQLAHASVIFNVICSFLTLPVLNLFSRFILSVHDKKK